MFADKECAIIETDCLSPSTKNKMPRTRTVSLYEKKVSSLSPVGSETGGHRLRRRNNVSNNHVASEDLKEDSITEKNPRELRSSVRQSIMVSKLV